MACRGTAFFLLFFIPIILKGSDVLLLDNFIKFCLEQRIESTLLYESAHLCYLFIVYLTTLFQKLRLYGVERKGHKWMSWKGFGRKRSWRNFKVLSRNSPRETEENHEKLRIIGLGAEIWTRDLPNTKQER
jgi:hypothetical protein